MLEDYLINENTLLIEPFGSKSRVYEKYICYVVNLLPIEIINKSCLYYGSSYKGRSDYTAYFLGTKYKNPIIINERKKIILFPTTSPQKKACYWINYKGISKFYTNKLSTTNIELINNKLITIQISNRIISNQILKSSRLDLICNRNNQ